MDIVGVDHLSIMKKKISLDGGFFLSNTKNQ